MSFTYSLTIPYPHSYPLVTISLFSKSVSLFLFWKWVHLYLFFCLFVSVYKWCHVIFVFFWFISLRLPISRSIQVVANGITSFFLMTVIFHCIHVPHLLVGIDISFLNWCIWHKPWEVILGHVCNLSFFRSCPTTCDAMDCSLLDSFGHGILQARILKWIAMPYPRGIFPT